MSPVLAGLNLVDDVDRNTNTNGDHARRHPGASDLKQLLDADCLSLSGCREEVSFSYHMPDGLRAVPHVLSVRHVTQVAQAIIGAIVVLVTNLESVRAGAYESRCYEDVNNSLLNLLPSAQADTNVAVLVCGAKDATGAAASGCPHAANSSDVGNLVQTFKVDDRTPFFGFKFFKGKVLIGHCGNLLERFQLWQERLEESHFFGPFAHNITNYEVITQ